MKLACLNMFVYCLVMSAFTPLARCIESRQTIRVGLTGYVHIMREGGKPVVLLLDDWCCMSSFLRRKKLDIGSRRECTGAETVACCCSDRQMYRSRNCRMPLFQQFGPTWREEAEKRTAPYLVGNVHRSWCIVRTWGTRGRQSALPSVFLGW
jgi:hypothetical protein